jgi:hypothetical protein
VEEKLFVNRYEDWLNVICCKKWTNQRYSSRCRCRAKVGRLANLASRLVLSLGVRVGKRLRNEKNGQDRQDENEHPHPVASRLVPVTTHRRPTLPHYPNLLFNARTAS